MEQPIVDPQKRKTCIACAKAKRPCDKASPQCQRCLQKSLVCQYPNVERYTRLRTRHRQPVPEDDGPPTSEFCLEQLLNFTPPAPEPSSARSVEDVDEDAVPDLSGSRPVQPEPTDSPTAITDLTRQKPQLARLWLCVGPSSWALDRETKLWHELPPNYVSRVMLWVDEVRVWLRTWIETGHNAFIHEQLYSCTGLPKCLQDAWSTLATYSLQTAQTKTITMQIVQSRANALLAENDGSGFLGTSTPALSTVDQLARVQALFIYQFIRLFDGDIGQRAQAEGHIYVLHEWGEQLWDSATTELGGGTNSWSIGAFDESSTRAKLWRNWLLSESVRRTWYVCKTLQSAYFALRDGWTECPGAVCFTARKALWEARSPAAWAESAMKKPLLLVSGLPIQPLYKSTRFDDVDSFSRLLLKMQWGAQTIEDWARESRSA